MKKNEIPLFLGCLKCQYSVYVRSQDKNQDIYFRFYFPENQMLLGSDYKDALGEVSLVES